MTTVDDIRSLFESQVPRDWFEGPLKVEADDEEVLCVGTLPAGESVGDFRERTRADRMAIAGEAEARFRRKVSWGVERDGATTLFTTVNAPVMTRLRLPERAVLDTLVDAGVARSRSEALAWCVKLVGRHQAEWIADLREALVSVEHARQGGPTLI
jgi:hypothetical protein